MGLTKTLKASVLALLAATSGGCTSRLASALSNPPPGLLAQVEPLYAPGVRFVRECATRARKEGAVLSDDERQLATGLGVKDIHRVRLVHVDRLPHPRDALLDEFYRRSSSASTGFTGFTCDHGIYLRRGTYTRALLAHELVHVAQYERLGVEGFVRRYYLELSAVGYWQSPLEVEAYTRSGQLSSDVPGR